MSPGQVAVFIDFENIARSAQQAYGECRLDVIFREAERYGRCVIKRAYCDWTRFASYRQQLIDHSVELIQLFAYGTWQSKNTADIQMVVDALETAFSHPDIDTFVLVTGDSDYSAVARKLRGYGKTVIGIGQRDATSEMLVKACDRFTLYDTLVEPATRTVTFGRQRARQVLLEALRGLGAASPDERVYASALKNAILDRDPTFNEVSLGFGQFKDFLQAQSDLVSLSTAEDNATELLVSIRPTAVAPPAADEAAAYRSALEAAGLSLLDPHTRVGVLQDLHELLSAEPGKHTLASAVERLKERYDTTNVLRTRDEVQAAARLIKYAQVAEPPPQSWELDTITLAPELDVQTFVDRCESSYLQVLLQKNISIRADVLAMLLYGTSDRRARVQRLEALAAQNLPGEQLKTGMGMAWDWSPLLRGNPALQQVFRDLEECELNGAISAARANELAHRGMEIRPSDFGTAAQCFLQAAKMTEALLRGGEPGVSVVDLEWQVASYCATTAGAEFLASNYERAQKYYLAFFALARDTEPVWEKLRALVRPMVSYYFAIAAFQQHVYLPIAPGRTDPARMAIVLTLLNNERVRAKWLALAAALAEINPGILYSVMQALEILERQGAEGASAALAALRTILPSRSSEES